MRYVVKRLTDNQFKTGASAYSNSPRWTVNIDNARVYNRRSDAVLSARNSRYPKNLIEVVPVKIVAVKS